VSAAMPNIADIPALLNPTGRTPGSR